jgi:WD40 repeat protein
MCSGVVFAPDGRALYTRSAAGLERWPIQPEPAGLAIGPRQHVMALPWRGTTGTLCPAADGKLAANLRDEGTIVLLDPRDPATAVTLPGHVATMNSLAASPDGRWVAARSWWDTPDKLRVSDVALQEVVWTHAFPVTGEFSPDSRWIVTGGDVCRIWPTGIWRDGREVPRPPGLGAVNHAVFAPDGITLAIAYEGRVVQLVDARTGGELATLPAPDLPAIDRLAFSPDGTRLAGAMGAVGVQMWDLRRIRARLADMGLDWDRLPYPPAPDARAPIKVRIVP